MSDEIEKQDEGQIIKQRRVLAFDTTNFGRLVRNDLSALKGAKGLLKKYKQSEVREIIENYKTDVNQRRLREISQLLYAKSPQYKRLIDHFGGMALFQHVITPIKDIKNANKSKVMKQYTQIGELLRLMSIKHEMKKVVTTAFKEDTFYGYLHRDKKSFYIQPFDASVCKIMSIESGVYNYGIDMSIFVNNDAKLREMPLEIQVKFRQWKDLKDQGLNISNFVELDAQNTICIKVNEDTYENFPPFAGSFDAIFDIEGFKQLRKDKEELGNYMIVTQELPMRKDSDDNNDFMIDEKMFRYFHNMASETVPENVGVITSPMKIEALKFDRDRVDSDGVARAERDFWSGSGTSQLLFNADKSTSQGLLMSIKTDEEIVFGVLTQIERWLNRYLNFEFSDLMFNVNMLHVTHFNREDMYKMYLEAGQYGIPVKSMLSATVGLDPIETMNMAYLENDLLKMHEEFIPLMSSHVMGNDAIAGMNGEDGRPKKSPKDTSDEGSRNQDKPNA